MTVYRKSDDHYLPATILVGIIFAALTAYAVYNYEAAISPWFYTVSFGGEANTTNGDFRIIFKPEVTHNQNNDTISFKIRVVNVGSQPVDLNWGEGSFRIRVFDEAGVQIPDAPASQAVIAIGYYRHLNPGEGIDFGAKWSRETYFIGEMRFMPGRYFVSRGL